MDICDVYQHVYCRSSDTGMGCSELREWSLQFTAVDICDVYQHVYCRSSDTGMGPLMRDVKNKICTDCDLIALLEDDTGMEVNVSSGDNSCVRVFLVSQSSL